MKNVICLFLFLLSTLVLPLSAQHLNPLQEGVVRKTISEQFMGLNQYRTLNLGKGMFCVVGNDTLYNLGGHNYVFKLYHDSITRLDHSQYHGNNHGRFLFAHNGELFALGGYGFFTTNNNLQVFNPQVKEWLFKPTRGDVPNYIYGLCFKIDDAVYSLNNFKSGNGTAPNLMDSCIYKLNLKTMIWERFYQLDYPSKISGPVYHSNQFSILRGELQTIIVKPSEFKFMILNNEAFGIDYISVIDSISDDKLFFTSSGSSYDNIEHYNIDLNTTWKKHANKAQSFNLKPIEKVNSIAFNTWFIVSIILLLTTVFVYFVMKRSQAKQNTFVMDAIHPDMIKEASIQTQTTFQTETLAETLPDAQTDIEDETQVVIGEEIQTDIEENLSDSLYRVLLQSEKTFFSGDELDEIFGIAHLEPDSKKSKRHRYLANLDKNHPGFVVRVKEQIDKRRFNYKIVK
jgi:hypothetical protein